MEQVETLMLFFHQIAALHASHPEKEQQRNNLDIQTEATQTNKQSK